VKPEVEGKQAPLPSVSRSSRVLKGLECRYCHSIFPMLLKLSLSINHQSEIIIAQFSFNEFLNRIRFSALKHCLDSDIEHSKPQFTLTISASETHP